MDANRYKDRAWAEIDEDAVIHNYRLAKSMCGKDVRVICVLKGNAYGLGLKRMARVFYEEGADFFAVACADEAKILREILPACRILILGKTGTDALEQMIRLHVELTAGTMMDAKEISLAAQKAGVPAKVHIKLDTGLHRLGFTNADEAAKACSLPYITTAGLFSHMALRSEEQSKAQYQLFEKMKKELEAKGISFPMCHLLDSIGLTRYPKWQMDAVRLGAFLYGNPPLTWKEKYLVRPVVKLYARVTRVEDVEAGEGIGYDDFPIRERKRIATVSAGYVDGYSRNMSDHGDIILHGKRARVVGRVCMDQLMADVTDIPETEEGDTALLLGGEISLPEYAERGNLNRNESLCMLGSRIPRLYMRNGQCADVSKPYIG